MYYGSALLLFTHKLHCFHRSLHVRSLDATCVQNFRPVLFTVFEILAFKQKKKKNENVDKNNNWTNRLLYARVSLLDNILWDCIVVVYM